MRQKRSRYIALCQQLLVVGTVGLLGATAAGIHTLEIVPAEPQVHANQMRTAVIQQIATVDVAPVSPRVEEVAVTGMDGNNSDDDSVENPGAASSGPADAKSQNRLSVPPTEEELPAGLKLAAVSLAEDVHVYNGGPGHGGFFAVTQGGDALGHHPAFSLDGLARVEFLNVPN